LLPFGTTEEPYETKKNGGTRLTIPQERNDGLLHKKTQQELEEPGDMRIGARLGKI
jgi:hypothetical protein